MLLIIFRILLIYWIITIVVKWAGSYFSTQNSSKTVSGNGQDGIRPVDIKSTGKIDDAEFEEIDNG